MEIKINTIRCYIYTPIRLTEMEKSLDMIASIGMDMEKLEFILTAGGNVKWHNEFAKQFGNLLR